MRDSFAPFVKQHELLSWSDRDAVMSLRFRFNSSLHNSALLRLLCSISIGLKLWEQVSWDNIW